MGEDVTVAGVGASSIVAARFGRRWRAEVTIAGRVYHDIGETWLQAVLGACAKAPQR